MMNKIICKWRNDICWTYLQNENSSSEEEEENLRLLCGRTPWSKTSLDCEHRQVCLSSEGKDSRRKTVTYWRMRTMKHIQSNHIDKTYFYSHFGSCFNHEKVRIKICSLIDSYCVLKHFVNSIVAVPTCWNLLILSPVKIISTDYHWMMATNRWSARGCRILIILTVREDRRIL